MHVTEIGSCAAHEGGVGGKHVPTQDYDYFSRFNSPTTSRRVGFLPALVSRRVDSLGRKRGGCNRIIPTTVVVFFFLLGRSALSLCRKGVGVQPPIP